MVEGKERRWSHPGKETRDSEYILRTQKWDRMERQKITTTFSSYRIQNANRKPVHGH